MIKIFYSIFIGFNNIESNFSVKFGVGNWSRKIKIGVEISLKWCNFNIKYSVVVEVALITKKKKMYHSIMVLINKISGFL